MASIPAVGEHEESEGRRDVPTELCLARGRHLPRSEITRAKQKGQEISTRSRTTVLHHRGEGGLSFGDPESERGCEACEAWALAFGGLQCLSHDSPRLSGEKTTGVA